MYYTKTYLRPSLHTIVIREGTIGIWLVGIWLVGLVAVIVWVGWSGSMALVVGGDGHSGSTIVAMVGVVIEVDVAEFSICVVITNFVVCNRVNIE